jgi:hypothetical protein
MNRSLHINIIPFLHGTAVKRGAIFGAILVASLLAFELFNYATTAFALSDVLGDLSLAGIRWATVLALAFCGIDFAGIARLFTPQQGRDEPTEVWYLFGAWLLAAAFNATLTWWGVSVAILHHTAQGSALVGQATLAKAVPVFVAVMVWLIRVLIIGAFSLAGDNMFSMAEGKATTRANYGTGSHGELARSFPRPPARPVPATRPLSQTAAGAEPTYHPASIGARSASEHTSLRQ